MIRKRPLLTLAVFTLLLLLPFIGRPVFIDDHGHIQQALALQNNAALPFANQNMPAADGNPAAYSYLILVISSVFGAALWKIKLALLPIHIAGVLAFYVIARRYLQDPLWAAALWAASPHFWLTANSLLLDAVVAPLMLIGLAAWIKGWEQEKPLFAAIGAFFLGAAVLTKYTAVIGWVAAVMWVMLESDRRRSWFWVWTSIPVGMFIGWSLWTRQVYGEVHFLSALRGFANVANLPKINSLVSFLVGSTPLLLFSSFIRAYMVSQKRWAGWLGFAVGAALAILTGYGFLMVFPMALAMGAFFAWVAMTRPQREGFRFSGVLLVWFWLGFAGIFCSRAWFSAKYFGVIGLPLIVLTVMAWEKRGFISEKMKAWVLAGLTSFGLMLAAADSVQAHVDLRMAELLNDWKVAERSEVKGYYPGALLSGMSFYLDPAQWSPAAPGQEIEKGAIVILPWRGLGVGLFPNIKNPVVLWNKGFGGRIPVRTFDPFTGGSFYGSIWGPVPFSFSFDPVEVYVVVEAG